jgi:hypothetical protein
MKRWMMVAMGIAMAFSLSASANILSFNFDAAALVTYPTYDTGTSATQPDAKELSVDTRASSNLSFKIDGGTQCNTILNWLDSLGANEGIAGFQLWLHPEWYASGRGMVLGPKPQNSNTGILGAAGPTGWTAGWGVPVEGYAAVITFQTTDPSKYLRPGSAAGTFTFTMDAQVGAGPAFTDAQDSYVSGNFRV